jgi:hypothetical protein
VEATLGTFGLKFCKVKQTEALEEAPPEGKRACPVTVASCARSMVGRARTMRAKMSLGVFT